jgi:tetratricopeptide (TPR) repeat protein
MVSKHPSKNKVRAIKSFWVTLPFAALLFSSTVLAADPFRTGANARPFGSALEKAFEDFFRTGNYLNSSRKLTAAQAENPNEPLVYTLQAALAYMNNQPQRVQAFAEQTRKVSLALEATDKARSHLYRGLADGLEGASYYLKDGEGSIGFVLPKAASMLKEINQAHKMAPEDPEINLVVGYINTVLSKLPLQSNKYNEALASFRKATPSYLAFRGKALVYRDTKNYPQAMTMVDQALKDAPQNPDLFYLKAQIFALQKNHAEAVTFFDKALSLGKQLPESTKKQIRRERTSQIRKLATTPNPAGTNPPTPSSKP